MAYTIKGAHKFSKLSEHIPREPEAWSCEDVSQWLRLIEMSQYIQNFRDMSIDGWLIFEIDEEDLVNDLKISKKLHRKKIMKGIKILKEYKTYVHNHFTKQPTQADTQYDMGDKNKQKDVQGPLQDLEEMGDQRKVNRVPLRDQFDDQTKHQGMGSKFAIKQESRIKKNFHTFFMNFWRIMN
jgi:hypothetical protein